MIRYAPLFGSSLILMSCASHSTIQPIPAEHPASPKAMEARPIRPSPALRPEAQDSQKTQTPLTTPDTSRSAPGHMHEMQHGANPAVPSQTQPASVPTAAMPVEQGTGSTYVCPMHPDVIQTKPGSCPKCGMKLIKKELKK